MLPRECRKFLRDQPPSVRAAFEKVVGALKMESVCLETEWFLSSLDTIQDLKLNLGCGADLKHGFVNIDYHEGSNPLGNRFSEDGASFVLYDLGARGIPFDDRTCGLIYTSHFLEHLDYVQGRRVLDDCFRVLHDGGRLRIVLPNIRRAMEAYINADVAYFDGITDPELAGLTHWMPYLRHEDVSFVDVVNLCVYQRGEHKCIYDEDKMLKILGNIGFSKVEVSGFDPGIDCDSDLRRKYSFYIDALK